MTDGNVFYNSSARDKFIQSCNIKSTCPRFWTICVKIEYKSVLVMQFIAINKVTPAIANTFLGPVILGTALNSYHGM